MTAQPVQAKPQRERACWDGSAPSQGLYNAHMEKDECGVGAICDFHRVASRKIVEDAKDMLVRMAHRGGESRPGDGDGAGLMCSIPDDFMRSRAPDILKDVAPGEYGVGNIFFPTHEAKRADSKALIKKTAAKLGLRILGWRRVETDKSKLGPYASMTEPYIAQVFVALIEDSKSTKDQLDANNYTIGKDSTYAADRATTGTGHARNNSKQTLDELFSVQL